MTTMQIIRREAALKAWRTRRAMAAKRSLAAIKAWVTRRAMAAHAIRVAAGRKAWGLG